MNLEAIIDAIADKVAERVLGKLSAAAPGLAKPILYTTHKNGPHLPGKPRRWMLDHIRSIPGAHKAGRDWVISPADYDAWLTAEDARRCAAKPKAEPAKVVQIRREDEDAATIAHRMARSISASGRRSR